MYHVKLIMIYPENRINVDSAERNLKFKETKRKQISTVFIFNET